MSPVNSSPTHEKQNAPYLSAYFVSPEDAAKRTPSFNTHCVSKTAIPLTINCQTNIHMNITGGRIVTNSRVAAPFLLPRKNCFSLSTIYIPPFHLRKIFVQLWPGTGNDIPLLKACKPYIQSSLADLFLEYYFNLTFLHPTQIFSSGTRSTSLNLGILKILLKDRGFKVRFNHHFNRIIASIDGSYHVPLHHFFFE